MSKIIDERIPRDAGKGALPSVPAVVTPWGKLISYHDACHYAARSVATHAALQMGAYRTLVAKYEDRAKYLCDDAYNRMSVMFHSAMGQIIGPKANFTPPFACGSFIGAQNGDTGDERLLMCGRVNDFSTCRCEKELDVCSWDIIGTELCRATTSSLEAVADGSAIWHHKGPKLDYQMVEARGAGDRHCRIVAENREKFPLPEHESWERFGPVVTSDMIKYTEEEYCVKESNIFREESGYRYLTGTVREEGPETALPACANNSGITYLNGVLEYCIKEGILAEEDVDRCLEAVLTAGGKAQFSDFFAIEGLRAWLGVPDDIHDGRVMGGYLETLLQILSKPYEVEEFNERQVILRINRKAFMNPSLPCPRQIKNYIAQWNGNVRTLVGAEWFVWEEDSTDAYVRVKIAKKIDKFA